MATSKKKKQRGKPIQNNSQQQCELFDLFEEKNWLVLPEKQERLDELVKRYSYSRGQVRNQFSIWKKFGRSSAAVVTVDFDRDLSSLQERCDTTAIILRRLNQTELVMQMIPHMGFHQQEIKWLHDLTYWEQFRTDCLEEIARGKQKKLDPAVWQIRGQELCPARRGT